MMSQIRLAAIAAFLVGTGILSACGDGGSSHPASTPSPIASLFSPTPATSSSSDTDLILHAFETSLVAFDVAVREMNPDDPAIPATTTGDQVIHELTTLNSWKAQGITAKSDRDLPHVIDSRVISMTPATATVKGCVYDPGVLIYKATGNDAPTNAAGQFYFDVDATLMFTSSVWKVSSSKTQSEFNACLPGY